MSTSCCDNSPGPTGPAAVQDHHARSLTGGHGEGCLVLGLLSWDLGPAPSVNLVLICPEAMGPL